MSAFGTKRTFSGSVPMSAFGGKADIDPRCRNVSLRNQDMCGSLSPFRPLQNPAVIAAQIIVLKEAHHTSNALHRRVHRIRPSGSRHQR